MWSAEVTGANSKFINVGQVRAKWSARGDRILSYHVDVAHKALNIHREVSAPEINILERKVQALLSDWEGKHAALLKKQSATAGRELAEQLGIEAEARRQKLRATLRSTLSVNDRVDWSKLEMRETLREQPFPERKPTPTPPPSPPVAREVGFWDSLFGKRLRIEAENRQALDWHKQAVTDLKEQHNASLTAWQSRKDAWDRAQKVKREEYDALRASENAKVAELKAAWGQGEASAVIEHASLVLEASQHDAVILKDYSVHFDPAQHLMVVDYRLPAPEDLPSVKSVKFVPSTGELKETHITQKEQAALFDDLCYQVCLRTIHELFEADEPKNIMSIVFNGTCEALDRSTGQMVVSTIMSLRAEREDFLAINLAAVDPRECFKRLKGVAASTLSGLTPVPPLVVVNREDRRFIEGRSVDLGNDGSVNLAAMSWEDFEHLVRELFEKEFASRGGEVRVTQASSDGGVDAVAFDPDPISGGKIVIQAKRYTKTVGVAAVRDLYGTVMNEGANKGILVTTSDFGPDAHKFAADKPLTLMGGANLLYLLEKHGQKARIDIKEARQEMGLR